MTAGRRRAGFVGLAVLVAAAAAAWFFVIPHGEAAAEEEHVPGAILALDAVAVNLAGGGYLKVGLALQLTEEGGAEAEALDGTKANDLMIAHFLKPSPAMLPELARRSRRLSR